MVVVIYGLPVLLAFVGVFCSRRYLCLASCVHWDLFCIWPAGFMMHFKSYTKLMFVPLAYTSKRERLMPAVSRSSLQAVALKPEFIIASLLLLIALGLPPTILGIVNPGKRVPYPALIGFAIAVCAEPKLPLAEGHTDGGVRWRLRSSSGSTLTFLSLV